MLYNMFHGKIHRATVTQANLEYMGSITIDEELLELAGILPGERVQVVNNNNGARLETPGINIAMPHTYPEHVIKPAILVATLENPIDFHEMGNSSNTVPAKLIFMLAVTDPKGHLEILSKLMSIFSQEDKLIDLYNSTQAKEIIDKLNKVLN